MRKLGSKELKAVRRDVIDGHHLNKWLMESLEDIHRSLETEDDANEILRLQGETRVIRSVLDKGLDESE